MKLILKFPARYLKLILRKVLYSIIVHDYGVQIQRTSKHRKMLYNNIAIKQYCYIMLIQVFFTMFKYNY